MFARLYLDLMERCLLNTIYEDPPMDHWTGGRYSEQIRVEGKDWPSYAHSMIGWNRMHQLRAACEIVIHEQIEGDFIETGVWRGGACIMMRAVLKAYDITDRRVWCADSFEGLPKPDAAIYPEDRNDEFHTFSAQLGVGVDQVQRNFDKYDLLDGQVRFLKGWFKDTLPSAPVEKLAVLRLDGDMYESTVQALSSLYHKVSPGGFVIVDDYGAVRGCRSAVDDFRRDHCIAEPLGRIDWAGVYWRRSRQC